MLRRPTLRTAAATTAAAVVLVGGVGLTSYAATGNPLLIGKSNRGVGTTSLKNLGRGPALSLNSAKSSPPFVVNSSKVVKHLNADTIHGAPASVAAPVNYQIRIAKIGAKWTDQKFVTSSVPPGVYQVTISGVAVPNVSAALTCLVGDKRFFTGTPTDFHQLWALDFNPAVPTSGMTVNAVATGTVTKHLKIVAGCLGTGATWTMYSPLVVNLTRVNGISARHTHGFTPSKVAVRALPGR
jgi:hypothetical protein